jgi:hypothetical protein
MPAVTDELKAYVANGVLYVCVSNQHEQLMVYNMQGQKVLDMSLRGNGYHEVSLNVVPGVYVVCLRSESGKKVKKLYIGK